jgi:hypothetical protein
VLAVVARLEAAGTNAGQHRRYRHPRAQALPQSRDVGDDPRVLLRQEAARARNACLNFVGNQQEVVHITQLAKPFEIVARGHHHASLPLNWLHHHGNGTAVDGFFQCLRVAEGDLDEARHRGWKQRIPTRLAACSHGGQRAPVEGAEGRHDAVRPPFVDAPPLARQLDGGFVGFGTAVDEVDLRRTRQLDEEPGEVQRWTVVKRRARGQQQARLLAECAFDLHRAKKVGCQVLELEVVRRKRNRARLRVRIRGSPSAGTPRPECEAVQWQRDAG